MKWPQLPFFKKKNPDEPKVKKSFFREWLDAFVFAGIVALVIRTFVVEAFVIPSSSMERSLMVGDFLFVSKFHYGARLPMAPLALPFVHNRIPGTNAKSFIDGVQLPYLRLPGISSVKRGDPLVFNYPADDIMPNNPDLGEVQIPSMKENYIKRCVGIPGDIFEIKAQQIYINGKPSENPEEMQFDYRVYVKGEGFSPEYLKKHGYRAPDDPNRNFRYDPTRGCFVFAMTAAMAEEFRGLSNVSRVVRDSVPASIPFPDCYPQNGRYFPWNIDNFGPMLIPARGSKIELNPKNVALYRRVIEGYEGHKLEEVPGGKYKIDGEAATSYTFKMNYYFLMGDNRNNSSDSRIWGMVPENHVVGKPLFIFFSKETKIRWNRIFKGIH